MFGETSGEIPMYSLHRIKRMMRRQPIAISPELLGLLLQNLISANADYKDASGNDWNCLTSENLVDAIEATNEMVEQGINGIKDIPKELAQMRDQLLAKLHRGRVANIKLIQKWFERNFDSLLYDMKSKIPWAVVCRLRRDLGYWIATKVNPFGKNIEEMVLEVAKEAGVVADDPEEAWEKMGGKIFTKAETDD
jgi:hypothetical protein